MASQPPLVVFLSMHAQRACYFYSIFDQRSYKATLPNLIGKSCFGLTCGYLVMVDKKKETHSQIWLLNPFTRPERCFPSPPYPYCSVVLASLALPLQDFVIIAIGIQCPFFCSVDPQMSIGLSMIIMTNLRAVLRTVLGGLLM